MPVVSNKTTQQQIEMSRKRKSMWLFSFKLKFMYFIDLRNLLKRPRRTAKLSGKEQITSELSFKKVNTKLHAFLKLIKPRF